MPSEQELSWTIRRLIQWGSGWLLKQDIEQPRLDVELLLADSLGLTRMELFLDMERPLDQVELAAFKSRIKRRAEREPVAYILGKRDFWKHSFTVGPAVLIPRPETETLIESVLSIYDDREQPLNILDVGVGSGAILFSLLVEFGNAKGVGVDISPAALAVAEKNRDRLELGNRATLLNGDLTTPLAPDSKFDLIVSNPPYIASTILSQLQPEVKDREPRLALDGGEDGLTIYRRLLPQAWNLLQTNGSLFVEIGHDQGRAVSELFVTAGFQQTTVSKDYGHRDRLVMGRKNSTS